MSNETLVFFRDARPLPLNRVNALAETGKLSPGPGCRNVIVGGPLVADSGVVVAGSVDLSASCEEMGAQLLAWRGPA